MDAAHDLDQFFRRLVREFVAGDDLRFVGREAEIACDGQCGDAVVAGDHGDLDAGLAAGLNRVAHAGAERIDHADEPEEGKARRFRGRVSRGDVGRPFGEREDAIAAASHVVGEVVPAGLIGWRAQGQDPFR